jgi:hypothetical protein
MFSVVCSTSSTAFSSSLSLLQDEMSAAKAMIGKYLSIGLNLG